MLSEKKVHLKWGSGDKQAGASHDVLHLFWWWIHTWAYVMYVQMITTELKWDAIRSVEKFIRYEELMWSVQTNRPLWKCLYIFNRLQANIRRTMWKCEARHLLPTLHFVAFFVIFIKLIFDDISLSFETLTVRHWI